MITTEIQPQPSGTEQLFCAVCGEPDEPDDELGEPVRRYELQRASAAICDRCLSDIADEYQRQHPPADPDPDLKRRLVRARQVFADARARIRYEHTHTGEISEGQQIRFLQLVDAIEPPADEPAIFGEAHVARVETAVTALRDRAIQLKLEGDICLSGLQRFLAACGLRQWTLGQPERTEGSPFAGDHDEDEDGGS